MKPFATLGSEISKVRERVRRGAESLRPAKVASDVRDQRDRLLAKLGEQTFRLIAERKLVVPKMLQESVERLASLLGVQLPSLESIAASQKTPSVPGQPGLRDSMVEGVAAVRSDTLGEYGASDVDEPALGDATVVTSAPNVSPPARAPNPPNKKASPHEPSARPQKKGAKKHKKR